MKRIPLISLYLSLIFYIGCKPSNIPAEFGGIGYMAGVGNYEGIWGPINYSDETYLIPSITYNNRLAKKISTIYDNCFYYLLGKNRSRLWFYDMKSHRIVIFDVIETDPAKREMYGGLSNSNNRNKKTQKIKLIGIHRYDESLSWLIDAPYLSKNSLNNLYATALESGIAPWDSLSPFDWQTFKLYRKDKKTMNLKIAFWRLEEWPKSKEYIQPPLFKHIVEDIRRYGIFNDLTPEEEAIKYYCLDSIGNGWEKIYQPLLEEQPDTMNLITEKEFFKLLK